jgi:hypothetical protein
MIHGHQIPASARSSRAPEIGQRGGDRAYTLTGTRPQGEGWCPYNLETERNRGTNGNSPAGQLGSNDNSQHVHHWWVPQMIVGEIFSLLSPLLITLTLVRMAWRFVQRKFVAFEGIVSSCLLAIDSFLGSYIGAPEDLASSCLYVWTVHFSTPTFIRLLILHHIYNLKSDIYIYIYIYIYINIKCNNRAP